MRVLIADDETITRIALRKHLKKWGYDVVEARDGREAWDLLCGENPPRIAILDWMMPEIEGVEICKRLHENESLQFVYSILLTVRKEKDDIIQALDSGAHDFLSKPVHTAELRSRIAVGVRLVEAEEKLRQSNMKILASIRYAQKLQRSLLPHPEEIKAYVPEIFCIWEPRDIVGGDIFFVERVGDGVIVTVADCTGHGVPGAFITMIVSSAMGRIIKDEGCRQPGEILQRLNFIVKSTLHQNLDHATSDDGLDAAVCHINRLGSENRQLTFAGARLPLFYYHDNQLHVIKGDRQSLGYKKSDLDYVFSNHTINIQDGMRFYLHTDGYVDQFGEGTRERFSMKRFKALLEENGHLEMEEQRDLLIRTFHEFKGEEDRLDDLTVLGFGF